MPAAASSRRRENQTVDLGLSEEESLVQLQQAVQQNDQDQDRNETSTTDNSDGNNTNDDAPATYTDGARKPIVAGADYASLRLLTRRQPKDPEHVLQGLDTSNMDLSWTAREDSTNLDPNGHPWRYPKKRGKGEGSNLDQFKDEITERTKNGEGCKAIAEAFIAMGVDTSVRAVARQRMKWGLRQRAKRKMTEQGIANIRKAHLEQAKRMANSDPVPVKRVRIRVMRKAEITRMTKEGMSAAQIAENLIARGVKLARGAATVERLRTVWGLTEDTQRSVNNIRATARNQALKAQQTQFVNIAKELGIEDVDGWVKSKMDEEVAQDARREYAYKLMGDARPKPVNPDQLRRNAAHLRSLKEQKKDKGNVLNKMPGVDFVPQVVSAAFNSSQNGGVSIPGNALAEGLPTVIPGPSVQAEIVEISDDEDDIEDEDMHGDETGEVDEAGEEHQAPSQAPIQAPPQTPTTSVDLDSSMIMQQQLAQGSTGITLFGTQPENVRPPVNTVTGEPGFKNAMFFKPFGCDGAPNQANVTIAPPAGIPGRRPNSFANITPRPMLAPRAIAPRPIPPQMPPFQPQKSEIDYMAQFGLSPYPCQGKSPQKYLTPNGLISTEGYEYLGAPPPPPGCEPPVHQPPPEIIRLPPPASADYIVVPRPPLPVPPKVSQVPQPPLIMPPEEVEKHNSEAKLLEKLQQTSQECLDVVSARASGKPMKNSLTGLPPSLQDIELAKEKLREVANAVLVEL
ncbi:hypothetical protein N0V93_008065 [Gnomoniopsis smithogilvyi]|uniref:Uncharacterized protein n=1 Tax=Gnomoniopsis smithogilvyi TaxID=1191159 RepID=A0A9W8YNF2_9PEZI|nr:hypothetical protein N0V93_008065 [Gnomoniopsis smithogilvyi]